MRVSRSKSGITRDGRFALVYRLADGSCRQPLLISKEEAIKVASRYIESGEADPSRRISPEAARYMSKKLQSHGWLNQHSSLATASAESSGVGSGNEDEASHKEFSTAISESNAPLHANPRHNYFPFLDANRAPKWDRQMLDVLAFVLSGVDPAKRVDPETANSEVTLSALYREPSARISPTKALMEDHWYVLAHLHPSEFQTFRDLWTDANQRLGGQDATNLIKVSRDLKRFKLSDSGSELLEHENREVITEFCEHAVGLLHRQFRNARRKLDEFHQQALNQPQANRKREFGARGRWWSLFSFKSKDLSERGSEMVVPVPEEVREIVQRYFEAAIKLGRILRSSVAKRSGHSASSPAKQHAEGARRQQ